MTSIVKPSTDSGAAAASATKRRGRLEPYVGGAAFAIFALLWIAFGAALIFNPGGLDAAWTWLRDLPVVLQAVVALLLLPVVAGLWIWETSWPLLLRLALVGGLAALNLYLFFPRSVRGRRG
jgi:hypothetical protein